MRDHERPSPARIQSLNDPRRLEYQVNESDLARLLSLSGDEDVIDLGSGTGFYTDRIAALTTGCVYAVEIQSEMNDHYRARGLPANVRLVEGDITALHIRADAASAPDPGRSSAPTAGGRLEPASVDVACTIATWHEVDGRMDLPGVAQILRPGGRLLVIDWRRDASSFASGPPKSERSIAAEVAESLAHHFLVSGSENAGRFMFAVTGRRF